MMTTLDTKDGPESALLTREGAAFPAADSFDDDWFARGERISSNPPPFKPAPSRARAEAPPVASDPIGDKLADVWFR
jgi:hypothetical protein